jgi:hypothetical protein
MSNLGPFEGDGRVKVQPLIQLPDTLPIPVTRAQGRNLIELFLRSKCSTHSARAAVLWVPLWYAMANCLPFRLTGQAMVGYCIELLPADFGTTQENP